MGLSGVHPGPATLPGKQLAALGAFCHHTSRDLCALCESLGFPFIPACLLFLVPRECFRNDKAMEAAQLHPNCWLGWWLALHSYSLPQISEGQAQAQGYISGGEGIPG